GSRVHCCRKSGPLLCGHGRKRVHSPGGGEPMREYLATAAAIGIILGVLAPDIDTAETSLIVRLCTGSECAMLHQQPVQTAAACSIPKCALPEDEPIPAPINER